MSDGQRRRVGVRNLQEVMREGDAADVVKRVAVNGHPGEDMLLNLRG